MMVILSSLLLFFGAAFVSNSKRDIAMYLYVQHSDSLVTADVKVNGRPVQFEPVRRQYLIMGSQLKRKGNKLSISKAGFAAELLDLDSMFAQHGRRDHVPEAVRLRHKWDGTYLQQGSKVPGGASENSIMIIGVTDTAAVFKAMKGHNLMLMRMYDYCGAGKDRSENKIDTYYFMHCYGAWFSKNNSSELRHLRKIFGEDRVGPVIRDGGPPKILTAQLEIAFKDHITIDQIEKILAHFQLTRVQATGSNSIVATANTGMGDHIVGIAHRLNELPEVKMVSNVVNALVCPG